MAETLPQEVLTKMYAPPKPNYPIITPETLTQYDAFLLGIPTRYGNMPAQWKVRSHDGSNATTVSPFIQAFWDSTGKLWAEGRLAGKYAATFISTAGLGGGQESTALACMSTLAHHGIVYVPFGYSHAFAQISNLKEVHGGKYLGPKVYWLPSLT